VRETGKKQWKEMRDKRKKQRLEKDSDFGEKKL
jgi:hypothetical protein